MQVEPEQEGNPAYVANISVLVKVTLLLGQLQRWVFRPGCHGDAVDEVIIGTAHVAAVAENILNALESSVGSVPVIFR